MSGRCPSQGGQQRDEHTQSIILNVNSGLVPVDYESGLASINFVKYFLSFFLERDRGLPLFRLDIIFTRKYCADIL